MDGNGVGGGGCEREKEFDIYIDEVVWREKQIHYIFYMEREKIREFVQFSWFIMMVILIELLLAHTHNSHYLMNGKFSDYFAVYFLEIIIRYPSVVDGGVVEMLFSDVPFIVVVVQVSLALHARINNKSKWTYEYCEKESEKVTHNCQMGRTIIMNLLHA